MTTVALKNYNGHSRSLATFWHGPDLSALDLACILSFVARGFDVTIYSYEKVGNLPSDIRTADAREIVSQDFLSAFVVMGKPSLSHFSDLFRYHLFRKTSAIWIDADLFCLEDLHLPVSGNVLARETDDRINGAIIRIDPADGLLDRLIEITESFAHGKEFKWGETGPSLVTKLLGPSSLASAFAPNCFYPFHWTEWWKPFLPSEKDNCEITAANSHALHLWNNILEKAGYWKDLAPPVGSYLHNCLTEYNLIHLFKTVLPEGTMKQLVDNYLQSQTASNIPIKGLARILLKRTADAIGGKTKS